MINQIWLKVQTRLFFQNAFFHPPTQRFHNHQKLFSTIEIYSNNNQRSLKHILEEFIWNKCLVSLVNFDQEVRAANASTSIVFDFKS